MHSVLAAAQPYLEEYGNVALFLMICLESFGVPLPGESLLIAAMVLVRQGDMPMVPTLLSAWAAAVLGDNIGYAIGRFAGRRAILRYGSKIGVTEPRLAAVEGFFRRYGGGVVLIARFVVPARQLNGLVAGVAGMSWWLFLAFNIVGAALWVGLWAVVGTFASDHAAGLLGWAERYGHTAVVGLVAVAAVVIAFLVHRKHRR